MNLVVLRGTLTRPPELRELRSGEQLVTYDLSVPRVDGGAAESVPVVWHSPPPSAAELAVHTQVVVIGRVRRRFFRAAGAIQSRTEVVAAKVLPTRRAKAAERAVSEALLEAEDLFTGSAA